MDIEVARTFLEVARCGSFIRAADVLHISPTAVSARIRLLEQRLDRAVFVRNKAGARLTPAGEQFMRYAVSLVQVWETACHTVALPPGRSAVIAIGAELSLWNPLLRNWLLWMREHRPDFALRTVVDTSERLVKDVEEGALNAAIIYGAPSHPGLVTELLFEEKLVLARTTSPASSDEQISIGWGDRIAANIRAAFPARATPAVAISHGPLALDYILSVGGSGYFREGFIRPQLESGAMEIVAEAPVFPYPAYLVSAAPGDRGLISVIRFGLRAVAVR